MLYNGFILTNAINKMMKQVMNKTLNQLEIEFEQYKQEDVFNLCTTSSYYENFGAFIAHGLKLVNHCENSLEY